MEEKNNNIKLYLIMFLLILICLLIFNYFIKKGQSNDDIWKYKNITSAADLISMGEKIATRKIYYTLEEIVVKYIESYLVIDENTSWQNYYDVLSREYNKYLSKKEYTFVAEEFLKKFYVYGEDNQIEANEYMDTQDIIKNIYQYDENKYLCELESSITGNVGYIGIELNENKQTYSIFYLE